MTWSAHFLADMFVPYHLNGIPVFQASSMINSGKSILTEKESGPLYLFNKTLSTQLPSESVVDQVLQEGYGRIAALIMSLQALPVFHNLLRFTISLQMLLCGQGMTLREYFYPRLRV